MRERENDPSRSLIAVCGERSCAHRFRGTVVRREAKKVLRFAHADSGAKAKAYGAQRKSDAFAEFLAETQKDFSNAGAERNAQAQKGVTNTRTERNPKT